MKRLYPVMFTPLLLVGCQPARVEPAAKTGTPECQHAAEHTKKVVSKKVAGERPTGRPVVETPRVNAAELRAQKRKAEAERKERLREQSRLALERGRERLREQQREEALEAFQEAVKLDKEQVDAWIRIAYVYELEGDMEKATEAFKEAKRLCAL